jgi:hypothetical protein
VPESGAVAGEPCPFAGVGEVLAGEAAGEDVDGIGVEEVSDVVVDGDVGAPAPEDALTGGIVFAGPSDVVEAGGFESEVEAAAAREERSDAEHVTES